MLSLKVRHDSLVFGDSLRVRFVRTLRILEGDQECSALPDLGSLPIFCASDFPGSAPAAWQARPTVFIPMHPQEAMWMQFLADGATPTAVKIGVAGVNALTGASWHERLCGDPQDYLVCPEQTRLDGYVVGDGSRRQFACLPLGLEDLVDPRWADQHGCSHLRLVVFEPKRSITGEPLARQGFEMSDLGPVSSFAGGKRAVVCSQTPGINVYPDRYGLHTWDSLRYGDVCVYLVNDRAFAQITGEEPEASPIPAGRFRNARAGGLGTHDDSRDAPPDDRPPKARYRPWVRRRRKAVHR